MIENLPLLTPDAARGANTLARCHDRLSARRRGIAARNRPPRRRIAVTLEGLLVAGLCMVYLVSMAGDVLSVLGAP